MSNLKCVLALAFVGGGVVSGTAFATAGDYSAWTPAVAAAGPSVSHASASCAHLKTLTTVFPRAIAVAFRSRGPIRAQRPRAPIWRGRCGAFWTTYGRYKGSGASVDVSVTLYRTSGNVAAPLAERAFGPVRTLLNGARVRTLGPSPVSVDGAPASGTYVASAYRNIFISSTSISRAKTPVPIAAQLRIHHQIETAFRALG